MKHLSIPLSRFVLFLVAVMMAFSCQKDVAPITPPAYVESNLNNKAARLPTDDLGEEACCIHYFLKINDVGYENGAQVDVMAGRTIKVWPYGWMNDANGNRFEFPLTGSSWSVPSSFIYTREYKHTDISSGIISPTGARDYTHDGVTNNGGQLYVVCAAGNSSGGHAYVYLHPIVPYMGF